MPLKTTPELFSLRGGSPASQIHVRNLRTTIPVGRDAWGRPSKIPQPLLTSVSVALSSRFVSSASSDSVDASTIHYGLLAKCILSVLDCYDGDAGASGGEGGGGGTGGGVQGKAGEKGPGCDGGARAVATLASVLARVWSHLTGISIDGGKKTFPYDERPFLDVTRLRSLALTLILPKASLLGKGVSITATALFGRPEVLSGVVSSYAMQLAIRRVRVPTLVGVNPKERLAKQLVIADVEVERLYIEDDIYTELEAVIVNVSHVPLLLR